MTPLIQRRNQSTNLKEAFRCLKHKIKQHKSVPVEESSSIDQNDAIDLTKKSIDEPEEAFRCLKHKIKQPKSVPVEESSSIDQNDAIDLTKKSIDELEETLCCFICPNMKLKSSRYQFRKQIRQPQLQIIIIHFEAKTTKT